jgi:hypothetical protein
MTCLSVHSLFILSKNNHKKNFGIFYPFFWFRIYFDLILLLKYWSFFVYYSDSSDIGDFIFMKRKKIYSKKIFKRKKIYIFWFFILKISMIGLSISCRFFDYIIINTNSYFSYACSDLLKNIFRVIVFILMETSSYLQFNLIGNLKTRTFFFVLFHF